MKRKILVLLSGSLAAAVFIAPLATQVSAQQPSPATSVEVDSQTSLEAGIMSNTENQESEARLQADSNSRASLAQNSGSGGADINGDGVVGYADLRILLNNWGECPSQEGTRAICAGDLNADKVVDGQDMSILLGAWTEGENRDRENVRNIPERCQAIRDRNLQRRCLMIASQEVETDMRRRRAATSLEVRISNIEEPERRERARQAVENVLENYLRYMSNMLTRMTAAVDRLMEINGRIESRIIKFEEAGFDVSEARELLDEAESQISTSRSQLAQVSSNYESVLSGENLTEEFSKVREMVSNVKESIMSSHSTQVRIITILKATTN